MSALLKIVKAADGRTVGFGPNVDFYEPAIPVGGRIEFADTAELESEPLPPPTQGELKTALTNAVQAHLDAGAQALGYDDIKTAATYADEPAVPKFQNEGKSLRAWRSYCWDYCNTVLADVTSGKRPIPTPEELIKELPIFQMSTT